MTPRSLIALLRPLLKLAGQHGWLTGLLWILLIAPAKAAVELRVAIEENTPAVNIGSSVNAVVRDAAGKAVGEIKGMNSFVAKRSSAGVTLDRWQSPILTVEPKQENGVVWIGDRWYRGRAVLVPTGQGLTAVNYVDIERYLYSVLGGEMNGNWPQEALKAQAVAARTYALYQRERTRSGVFDVGDTTRWQVYRGVQDESSGTQMAVNATEGQVLTYQGRLIEAVFHSSAGGYTDNSEEIWSEARPYLRAVPDFDQGAPVYQWRKTFTPAQLSSLIPGIGEIRAFEPQQVTTGGRVKRMLVKGSQGTQTIEGDRMRDLLDLRSTKFAVKPIYGKLASKNAPQAVPASFEVDGNGFGHGLGLSQYGAYNLAKEGKNYQTIVLHYFSSTQLSRIQVQ
jgi:stage II sporulation protein D